MSSLYDEILYESRNKPTKEKAIEPIDYQTLINLQREYLEEIKPYVQIQANILNMQPVRYVQQDDIWFKEIIWDLESKKIYDMITEVINYIGKKLNIDK